MNTLDKRVRDLVKYEKSLRGISFRVVGTSDGVTKIKIGKKIDFAIAPSKEIAEKMVEEFLVVINRNADYVSTCITHISNRVEQLQLELFGKADGDGKLERNAVGVEEASELRSNSVEQAGTSEQNKVR